MESQYKVSSTEGIESDIRENRRKMRGCDAVLRLLALALSLAAAALLGVDKENKTVELLLVPTLPPVNVAVTAKWHYLSAFTFFIVANAITSGHAAISLFISLTNRDGKKGTKMTIFLFDLMMVALLFSSVGAALAIGIMGYKGNSHVQWKKVCDVFDKFCDQAAIAMGLSGTAAVVFVFLVALAIFNIHKK